MVLGLIASWRHLRQAPDRNVSASATLLLELSFATLLGILRRYSTTTAIDAVCSARDCPSNCSKDPESLGRSFSNNGEWCPMRWMPHPTASID